MNILLTGDVVGGVGTHAQTLARCLTRRGHRITLVLFGQEPRPLRAAMASAEAAGVRCVGLPFALEWQSERTVEELESSRAAGRRWLRRLAGANKSEILHVNQFAWVDCVPHCPTLLGVHSDVVSWWRAVHNGSPPMTAYHRWYRDLAEVALQRADGVAAPTQAALDDLAISFGYHGGEVVNNGVDEIATTEGPVRSGALSVGRLWDEGKQMNLLWKHPLPLPVTIAGEMGGRSAPSCHHLTYAGHLNAAQTEAAMRRAQLYIATSAYEPFGLAPLEAARAGCSLLLNDLASLREVWGPAAFYFRHNDADHLSACLQRLTAHPELVRRGAHRATEHARKYTADAMSARYEKIYCRLRADQRLPGRRTARRNCGHPSAHTR